MKITAEFDSIMEVLKFADTFGNKKLSSTKVEDAELTVTEDVELTKPVQLHSPDVPPIAPSVPAPKVTPVQTPPPVQPQAPQQNVAPPIAPVPTTTQAYTMEQLAVAATQIVDAGHRNELVSLLASFGVQALTALPKEQYGAFATQLRGLGAKI
jgi:hypothetical protein